MKHKYDATLLLMSSIEDPLKTAKGTPPMQDEEIDLILGDVERVKQFLFCCLLLGHATFLPMALLVNSLQKFLDNPEVT